MNTKVRLLSFLSAAMILAWLISAGAAAVQDTDPKGTVNSAGAAIDASPSLDAGKAAEEIIEVVGVREVAKTPPTKGMFGLPNSLLTQLVRFHPALVHMPIAWVMMLLMVDLITFVLGRRWQQFGLFVISLTFLSCIPTIITGLLHAAETSGGGPLSPGTLLHRNLAIASTTVLFAALVFRLARKNNFEGKAAKTIYILLITTAVILFSITGHLGGKLVFGDNFAPF